jgi:hypothetical protein
MEQTAMQAKDVLTWTQVAYYGAGALVAFAIAYIKIKAIFRRRKKERK